MALFRKTKYIHLPASLMGGLIWLIAVLFLATVFIAADRSAHSVSDMFYDVFPYFVPTFLLVEWFASKNS